MLELHMLSRAARVALFAGAAAIYSAALTAVRAGDAPAIAAAASLRPVLDELAKSFEREGGQSVRLTYGATGNLVHQIEAGAPFEALFAADDESVKKLAAGGHTEGEPVVFAHGQLSLIAAKGSPVAVDSELKGLKAALAAGKVKHVSIANPETAPYGRAARESLQRQGLWDQVQPLLVIGENVSQAAQFASTGAAEAGLVAKSLAISAELAPKIEAVVVPDGWHEPIDHGMALTKSATPAARAFADYVRGPEGRKALEAGGFSVPAP
jgi:molybdate transport system substrate-binding protein